MAEIARNYHSRESSHSRVRGGDYIVIPRYSSQVAIARSLRGDCAAVTRYCIRLKCYAFVETSIPICGEITLKGISKN